MFVAVPAKIDICFAQCCSIADSEQWIFTRRMFEHPTVSDKITHPYDLENRGNNVGNMWGQRVTSLVVSGAHLYVSTSAKAPYPWEPQKYPFLTPSKWKSYGKVYQLTTPGSLAACLKWTTGPTILTFSLKANELSIHQDGLLLARSQVTGKIRDLVQAMRISQRVRWGNGVYGRYGGKALEGRVVQ